MGAAVGLVFPGFYVAGSRMMGDDARVSPLLIAAGLAGGISLPLILGAVMRFQGDGILFPLVAALMLASAACALAAHGRIGRETAAA